MQVRQPALQRRVRNNDSRLRIQGASGRQQAMRYLLLLLLVVCAGLAPPPVCADTPEEQLAAASALFDAQRYAEAAQKLDAFLAANPKHARAAAAALALGRCRAELK